MSNLVLPTLPGVKINVTREPIVSTLRQQTATGRELKASFQTVPRYRYSLSYEILIEPRPPASPTRSPCR